MEAKNVLALMIVLGAGFGAGFFIGRRGTGDSQEAVRQAREECDARLRLAGGEATPAAPAQTDAEKDQAKREAEAAAKLSGQQQVERLIREKGLPLAPDEPTDGTTDAPSRPPAGDAPPSPGFPKVSGLSASPAGNGLTVRGTVKNESSGPCQSVMIDVTALDSRRIPIDTAGGSASPPDLEPFASGVFEIHFANLKGAASFQATASCS